MSEQFRDDTIYHLLLQQALLTYRVPIWHLTIDRSNWIPKKQDLLMVSLSYHKRAIPIAWQIHDFGPTNAQEQVETILEDETAVFNPTLNDIDGDALFIDSFNPPSNGIAINSYTPNKWVSTVTAAPPTLCNSPILALDT